MMDQKRCSHTPLQVRYDFGNEECSRLRTGRRSWDSTNNRHICRLERTKNQRSMSRNGTYSSFFGYTYSSFFGYKAARLSFPKSRRVQSSQRWPQKKAKIPGETAVATRVPLLPLPPTTACRQPQHPFPTVREPTTNSPDSFMPRRKSSHNKKPSSATNMGRPVIGGSVRWRASHRSLQRHDNVAVHVIDAVPPGSRRCCP